MSFDDGATWYEALDTMAAYAPTMAMMVVLNNPALVSAGSAISSGASGIFTAIDPTRFQGINCLKIRSGQVDGPVVQEANVALTVVLV